MYGGNVCLMVAQQGCGLHRPGNLSSCLIITKGGLIILTLVSWFQLPFPSSRATGTGWSVANLNFIGVM